MLQPNIITTLTETPDLYQPGAPLWTEPHIAEEMLKAHLYPETDAASYRPETIDLICSTLPERMKLPRGARVLDLGCGPGLYCKNLARRGFSVAGVDWSENSIRYAKQLCRGLSADFLCASYLDPLPQRKFDGAVMISQDYGVLAPQDRKKLLANIRAALVSGGRFAFDVSSAAAFENLKQNAVQTWEAAAEGFWRAHPYLTLQKLFLFTDVPASCSLYVVIDEEMAVYRVWQTYFTPESIERELHESGFEVEEISADLAGGKWRADSAALGVVCRKRE
jgi:SAM-dependent methyltransferase